MSTGARLDSLCERESDAMTAVLLNGAPSPTDPTHALCTEVERQLAAHLETVRSFHLAGYDIGHCMGEFDCFVKTPGRCRIHDEGQEIERAVHNAELVPMARRGRRRPAGPGAPVAERCRAGRRGAASGDG